MTLKIMPLPKIVNTAKTHHSPSHDDMPSLYPDKVKPVDLVST